MRRPFAIRSVRLPLVVAMFALAAVPACRSASPEESGMEEATPETAMLRVTNDNFNDIEIFAMRSGVRTRIGRVPAGSSGMFTLSSDQIGTGNLNLVAVTSIGGGAVSSGSLLVSPGQLVEFRIMPVISESVAVVR